MRLWSLHPCYLDRIGLIALWREALLAKKVLLGKTKGYKNHPQLLRFKKQKNPILAINTYLFYIFKEGKKRGYYFKSAKIGKVDTKINFTLTLGQLKYEKKHLLTKLKKRDILFFKKLKQVKKVKVNPLFKIVNGKIENWEKQK